MRLLKKHSGAGKSPLSHVMLASAAAGAALVAFLGSPLAALAEEAADQAQETPSAFDILIPKPAEFIPALIAFLVIWVALAKFVWPSVLKTLDKRQQTIQDNLDAAEENKLQTARAYEKAQGTVEDAQAQAEDIVNEARRDAEATREAIIKKANADAERINNKAFENIQAEKNAAMIGLQDQMADLAVDLAGEIIGEHLDAKAQRKLIEDSLKEATTPEGVSAEGAAPATAAGATDDATAGGAHGSN